MQGTATQVLSGIKLAAGQTVAMAKQRSYFTISEVASLVGISCSSLRNWEKQGLFKATRTTAGYRLYTQETVAQLRQIKYLRSVKRVNVAGIAQLQRERELDTTSVLTPGKSIAELLPRLAELRQMQHLTLPEVSQRTGLPVRLLKRIEVGAAKPSVAELQKLAEVYHTSILDFFESGAEDRKLVRRADRRILRYDSSIQMELLAIGRKQMEPHIFRIAPRASSGGSYQHQGEEFLYLLQGKLEIWLDEVERYVLEPGDSLYFKSTQSHRWCSLTDSECVLLWINTPATF